MIWVCNIVSLEDMFFSLDTEVQILFNKFLRQFYTLFTSNTYSNLWLKKEAHPKHAMLASWSEYSDKRFRPSHLEFGGTLSLSLFFSFSFFLFFSFLFFFFVSLLDLSRSSSRSSVGKCQHQNHMNRNKQGAQ